MTAQNSGKTSKRKMPKGKPFVKGDPRINKGGRPKGIATIVRELTGEDGDKLIETAWKIAQSKVKFDHVTSQGYVVKAGPPANVCLDAIKYITARGHGKEPTTIEITGKGGGPLTIAQVDLRKLTDEQLEQFEQLVAAATSSEPGGNPGREDETEAAEAGQGV